MKTMETDQQTLLRRDAEWSALASAGRDIEGILSYWTDDAIVIPPGAPPIVGKGALREFIRSSLAMPGFTISWTSSDPVVSQDGSLAYLMGENRMTMHGPDGVPVTVTGRGVTIWRKEPDGEWRCVVDVWNAPPQG